MNNKYQAAVDRFYRTGIIPVIKLEQKEMAAPLARALLKGNVPLAEVTFRADGAQHVIDAMRNADDRVFAGAGTVLTVKQADEAIAAGAEFIVAPGFNEKIVDHCLTKDIPVFPGCVTPTEIERAMAYGLTVLKFFPAQQMGGMAMINALRGPYSHIRFMPTGGISLANLKEYAASEAIVACGGTFMVKADMLSGQRWDEITAQCVKATEIIREARR